jgi:subtilase family serine protease
MTIEIVLKPRDPQYLARFATEVSTPGSPLFRHYLDRTQLAAVFGPSAAELAVVLHALRSARLRVGAISPDHLSVEIKGSAAQLAVSFSTRFERYRLPGGRVAFANTVPPLFPATWSRDVQAVVGLDTLSVPGPVALQELGPARKRTSSIPASGGSGDQAVYTGGPRGCAAALAAASSYGTYTADQLGASYSFAGFYQAGDGGAGKVALLELEDDQASDIAGFQSCYKTHASVSYTKVDGGPTSTVESGEAALDIEDVIGLAPGASIEVYQGPDSQAGVLDTYRAIVDDSPAHIVSTSWGWCEAGVSVAQLKAEATLFQMAAARGQTVLAAAGDYGSEGCGPSGGLAVDDPGSQPYVTGVGGTELETISPPPLETVWDVDGAGGGGGGVSKIWPMPSYQSGSGRSLRVVSPYSTGSSCHAAAGSYCREVPDVSADADPMTGYTVYYDGGWRDFGGTSAAAPLWAALVALTNASHQCSGHAVGFLNPALYKAAGSSYSADFGDITTGNNDLTHTNDGLYPAGTGYDMASGLGTPVAINLARSLCETKTPPDTVKVPNPGSVTTRLSQPVSLQVTGSDSAKTELSFSATGLPPGTHVDASGAISGSPTAPGIFAVTVTASDSTGSGSSTEFLWSVVPADAEIVSVANPGNQATLRGTAVELQVEATASPPAYLSYSEIGLPGSLILDQSTGEINGSVHTSAGVYQVVVTATAPGGASASIYFTWTVTVTADSVTVRNPGNQTTGEGKSVHMDIDATDSAGLDTVFSARGLPPGLSISPAGTVTGAPSRADVYSVTVTATDSEDKSGSAAFKWTVD